MSNVKTAPSTQVYTSRTRIYRKYLWCIIIIRTRDRVHIRSYQSSTSAAALWSKRPPPRHNTVEYTTIRFRVPQTAADMFSVDRPRTAAVYTIYVVVHVGSDDVLALNHVMMEPGRKLLKSNPKSAAACTTRALISN